MSHKLHSLLVTCVIFLLLLVSAVGLSCSTATQNEETDRLLLKIEDVEIYYDLKNPADKYELPKELTEVSGLAWLGDDRIICIEDENGMVYTYDIHQRQVVHSITFGQPGDYEGIALRDSQVYVIRSDGNIYQLTYTSLDAAEAKKYETPLSSSNDVEGLAYDPVRDRLLVACKEDNEIGNASTEGKAIYPFDLTSNRLEEEVVYAITVDDLDDFLSEKKGSSVDKDQLKFAPSGIAYNPADGYFYVIASEGRLIVVLNKKGEIKATYPMAPSLLSQPEGICFAPNGDLYISSEGDGGNGYMLTYSVKRK